WQPPHLLGNLSRCVASVGCMIWCEEWQVVHTGALPSPFCQARPCAEPSFQAARIPTWHLPQVSGTCARDTFESGSFTLRIECEPWQSLHDGATLDSPDLSSARAWMLPRYASSTLGSLWQRPQACTWLNAAMGDLALVTGCTSCASPWHSLQPSFRC